MQKKWKTETIWPTGKVITYWHTQAEANQKAFNDRQRGAFKTKASRL